MRDIVGRDNTREWVLEGMDFTEVCDVLEFHYLHGKVPAKLDGKSVAPEAEQARKRKERVDTINIEED